MKNIKWFASLIMKNIVVYASPSRIRFPVKLICCIAFELASSGFFFT